MKPIIILLAILVVGGAIVWLIDKLFYGKAAENTDETDENTATVTSQGCADESCGIRSICPSEQILQGECRQGEKAVYFDDEELDAFAGRQRDEYTPDEVEQWRDVLYTLQPSDLLAWGQSIKHRGLIMPTAIHEEFLQLAAESRG